MAKDDRDILELLKQELSFIEEGGYGRSVRTPWLPKSVFQDSLSLPELWISLSRSPVLRMSFA